MKAPDKICIRKDDTSPLGLTPHWIYTTKVQEQDIVYIRKDALLEWANGEKMPGNSAEGKGWNLALQTLIDKLNSL